MKERFKQLPEPLQQQVIRRFAVTIVFVLLFFITLFGFWDVCLFLPCLLFAGFFIVNALRLFYTCIRGDYISVSGTCVQVETTAIRKRVKSLMLEYEEEVPRLLTVSIHERIKRLNVGDTVTIYLSEKTPVCRRSRLFSKRISFPKANSLLSRKIWRVRSHSNGVILIWQRR